MCGGTPRMPAAANTAKGLSPRVRGNPIAAPDRPRNQGSIPACAGEPGGVYGDDTLYMVYPRVCGGTDALREYQLALDGLSPRVRGNRITRLSAAGMIGSIPACAGEPTGVKISHNDMKVYPRVCGGTPGSTVCPQLLEGLSPRVRGNRIYNAGRAGFSRSIPACAGEPGGLLPLGDMDGVYPRVCGGTYGENSLRSVRVGLSPRVRGNLAPCAASPPPSGSIPACAGEPLGVLIVTPATVFAMGIMLRR